MCVLNCSPFQKPRCAIPSPNRIFHKSPVFVVGSVRKGEAQKKGLELGELQQHLFHTLQEPLLHGLGFHDLSSGSAPESRSVRSNVPG